MILSMSEQAYLFFIAVLIGFFIGFVYDILRIFRKVIHHANFFIHLEDLFYWLFVAFIMFYIMLGKNYGEIRGFSILGNIIGMSIYFMTLSIWIIKISITVIEFIKKVLLAIFKIVLYPIKICLRLLSYPYHFVEKRLKIASFATRKVLQKSKRYAKIKSTKTKNNLRIMLKKL